MEVHKGQEQILRKIRFKPLKIAELLGLLFITANTVIALISLIVEIISLIN